MNYLQCKLRKDNSETVSWIPEKHAFQNHIVKLKQDDGTWDDGWKVVDVWSVALEESVMNKRSRDHTKQREASDI